MTALSIRAFASATSVSITLLTSTFLALAMSAMLWPLARSAFKSAGEIPRALATGSSVMPAAKRPKAPKRGPPGPPRPPFAGPWSPNFGHGLFTMSPMRSLSALVIAAMTVLMSTFCCLATSAIVVLPSLNFVSSWSVVRLSALAAASISGEPGPGRVPLAPPVVVPVEAIGTAVFGNCAAPERPGTPTSAPPTAPTPTAAATAMPATNRLRCICIPSKRPGKVIIGYLPGIDLGAHSEFTGKMPGQCTFWPIRSPRSGRTQHAHNFGCDHE